MCCRILASGTLGQVNAQSKQKVTESHIWLESVPKSHVLGLDELLYALDPMRPRSNVLVGRNIRNLRELRDWSQDQLAVLLGVDRTAVNRWEKGPDGRAPLSLTNSARSLALI